VGIFKTLQNLTSNQAVGLSFSIESFLDFQASQSGWWEFLKPSKIFTSNQAVGLSFSVESFLDFQAFHNLGGGNF